MGKISNNTNNKGFTLVEVLLLTVVLILVGGLVYLGFKQVNKQSETSTSSTTATTTKTTPVKDETADWFTYTPDSKAYSIRIPDGWQLHYLTDDNGGTGDPYSWDGKELSYKAGTKATIIQDIGGRDGSYFPFVLISEPKNDFKEGDQHSQYKTNSGMDVTKYLYVQGADQEGFMPPPVGTKIYTWSITQATKTIVIKHSFIPGDTDNSVLVEKMINTLKIN
jgi:hypothetical protein